MSADLVHSYLQKVRTLTRDQVATVLEVAQRLDLSAREVDRLLKEVDEYPRYYPHFAYHVACFAGARVYNERG